MALNSLDDKLLGEKAHYYCSSSEDEDDDAPKYDSDENNKENEAGKSKPDSECVVQEEMSGKTNYTGPKGVIADWQRYKKLETEKRENDKKEKAKLYKKLAHTCRTLKEDEEEKKKEEDDYRLSDDEEFLDWYKQKRILELTQKFAAKWASKSFGKLYELNRGNFIEAIEKERKDVTIVIHIYDDNVPACQAISGCMRVLAEEYKNVKFSQIHVSEAKVSDEFVCNALPTIIAYKDNTIIGNHVRVSDVLGEDFYASDLEAFLIEYGILSSPFIKNSLTSKTVDEDSD